METAIPNQVNETPTKTTVGEPGKLEVETKVEPAAEVKEEPKKEEPKTPEFMSEKFAQLSKKEKAIVKARQELALEKEKIARERDQNAKDLEEFKRWKAIKDNAADRKSVV